MSRLIKIGEAAKLLGISVQTLRKWERTGELTPDRKSQGGTRYYDLDCLLGQRDVETDLTIAYARVSRSGFRTSAEVLKPLQATIKRTT